MKKTSKHSTRWKLGSEPPPSSGKDHSVVYLALIRIGPLAYPVTVNYTDDGWKYLETGEWCNVKYWIPIPGIPRACNKWTLQ